jgi:hypothetical protein
MYRFIAPAALSLLVLILISCNPEVDFSPQIPPSTPYACPASLPESDRYMAVDWHQAPAYIRNYVSEYYPGITPALVIRDESDPDDYEVYIRMQAWWMVLSFEDGSRRSYEAAGFFLDALPNAVFDCLASRFPGAVPIHYYAEYDGDLTVYIQYQGVIYELDIDRSSQDSGLGNPASCNAEEEDRYLPLDIQQLSLAIRQQLQSAFPNQAPFLILRELDDNDTSLYFLDNNQWRYLEFEGNSLTESTIEGTYVEQMPDWLSACLEAAYPDAELRLVYREYDGDYTVYVYDGQHVREIHYEN